VTPGLIHHGGGGGVIEGGVGRVGEEGTEGREADKDTAPDRPVTCGISSSSSDGSGGGGSSRGSMVRSGVFLMYWFSL